MNTNHTDISPLYAPLGKVALQFSNLEWNVGFVIVGILRIDPNVGLALVSEMSFARKLDALASVFPLVVKDSDLNDECKVLMKTLSIAEQERNMTLHSSWGLFGSGGFIRLKHSAKRRKGLQGGVTKASVADIEAVSTKIGAANHALFGWASKLEMRGHIGFKYFSNVRLADKTCERGAKGEKAEA